MHRIIKLAFCGFLAFAMLAGSNSAKADMVGPGPIPQRVGRADTVVLGKVKNFEKKAVSLPQFPGAEEKSDYLVAVVNIDEAIKGAKGISAIRVGLLQPSPPPQGAGAGGPVAAQPIRRGAGMPTLTENQEVCLFLQPHHSGEFYIAQMYFDIIDSRSKNFESEVKLAKKCVKLLADPDKGLDATDAHERLLTAALLITQFRNVPVNSQGEPKQEKISAELSKKILRILIQANWNDPNDPELGYMTAQHLFFQLGVNEQDGFTVPPDGGQIANAAKAWLTKNADTYRIQRFLQDAGGTTPKKTGDK